MEKKICSHCGQSDNKCVCLVEGEPLLNQSPLKNSKKPPVKKHKVITFIGKALALIMALACGVSTAGALVTAEIVTGGTITYALAGLLGICTTGINYYIFRNPTPEVLIDILKGHLFKDSDGKPLSPKRKAVMAFGFLCAFSVGATFAALSYGSTFTLAYAFPFLAAASAAFPPIAATLAAVNLICTTALMLKDFSTLIKDKQAVAKCKKFIFDLFDTNPQSEQNKGKSLGRIYAERITTGLFMIVGLGLAAIGLYMTMYSCAPQVKDLLLKIPSAAAGTVSAVSLVISMGFAMLGQIPFTIKCACTTVVNAISSIFGGNKNHKEEPSKEATTAKAPQAPPSKTWGSKVWAVIHFILMVSFQSARTINAGGNGLIAMNGASTNAEKGLAFAGAATSSFAAASSGDSSPSTPPPEKNPSSSNSQPSSPQESKLDLLPPGSQRKLPHLIIPEYDSGTLSINVSPAHSVSPVISSSSNVPSIAQNQNSFHQQNKDTPSPTSSNDESMNETDEHQSLIQKNGISSKFFSRSKERTADGTSHVVVDKMTNTCR